jgi:hypothetical protein
MNASSELRIRSGIGRRHGHPHQYCRGVLVLVFAATLGVIASAHLAAAAPPSAAPVSASASSSSSASASSATSDAIPEVSVTAHRASLARQVSKFVNQVLAFENAAGIPLWKVPVCPMEFGFSPEEGGFITRRLSRIARAAKVPLADEYCDPPNLFLVVTDDPRALLQGWNDRSPTRMEVFGGASEDLFAGAPQSVINEFIETPRAVKVWYFTRKEEASGLSISTGISPYDPPQIRADGTRIVSSNMLYEFFRVFVIADRTRLQGLTIDQVADYLSMVGLAKLKPGASLGDAPTILKLFDGAPGNAPAGMSEWDRAFLKSLYSSDPNTRRGQIARAIVREIDH